MKRFILMAISGLVLFCRPYATDIGSHEIRTPPKSTEVNYELKPEMDSYELELLARIVNSEARGEVSRGQRAVACVVMNRVESGVFPNTVYEVVYESGQFCGVREHSFNEEPSQEVKENVREVYNGLRELPKDVMFFKAADTDSWDREYWGSIGNHEFYR